MPSSPSPVLDAEGRAWKYWFIDGLPNLVAGLLCLLLSGTLIFLARRPHTHSPLLIALAFLVIGVFSIAFFRLRQTLEWLKSRITYPRTGYTAPPYFTEDATPADLTMLTLSGTAQKESFGALRVREDLRRRVWFFLAIFTAAVIAGEFIPSQRVCAAAGCVAGLVIWLASRKDGRMSWTVVFGLLFSEMYTLILRLPHSNRVASFMAGVGFMLALTGAAMLIRYLRRNPVARA